MFKSRMILLTLAAAAASTLFAVGTADAFWHRRCCGGWGAGYGAYSTGYWPGYSTGYWPGYTTGYWPAYTTSYWPGHTSYYGGYYGGNGGCCGGSACSSCCGSYSGYSGYEASYSTYPGYSPAYYSPPVYGGCSSCMGSTTTTGAAYATVVSNTRPSAPAPTATGQIVFSVRVPVDAKVFVNDRPTSSTGTLRSYAANGLLTGYQYGFTVRSERVVDGRVVSETQTLRLTPGQTGQLAFNLTSSSTVVASQQIRPMVSMTSAR